MQMYTTKGLKTTVLNHVPPDMTMLQDVHFFNRSDSIIVAKIWGYKEPEHIEILNRTLALFHYETEHFNYRKFPNTIRTVNYVELTDSLDRWDEEQTK